jgi:D-alanyl-D-alanine carboxypeptidase (penicillin-binding protein 5/6)
VCFGWVLIVLALISWSYAQGDKTSREAPAAAAPTGGRQEVITIHAKSAVLMEASNGQLLVAQNQEEKIPPASFAKLLTLYVLFDAIKSGKVQLSEGALISQKAWQTGGSKMFVDVGDRVPIEDLIKGITVVSGNDACVAVAEHISGSIDAFVATMNETAQQLGMTHSHFSTPHGLPSPEQYTTTYDMAVLARRYIEDFPEALPYHGMQEYTYAGIKQFNRNRLLKTDPSVDGLKTGHIEASGYHLLATAKRDERRLIAVVMGTESPALREEEALKLLNYGYRNFVFVTLFQKREVLHTLPVWKGKEGQLPVVGGGTGTVIVPAAYKDKIGIEKIVPKYVIAPIAKQQEVGMYTVRVDGNMVRTIPLVASIDIPKAGIFTTIPHSVYLLGTGKLLLVLLSLIVIGVVVFIAVNFVRWKRRRRRRMRVRI